MYQIQNYINGKYSDFNNKDNIDIYNPSTGEIIGSVVNSDSTELEKTIEVSKKHN